MDIEEVKRRLIQAMQLNEDVHEHWLETAEFMLESYRGLRLRQRVYDISTVGARIRTAREVVGLTQAQLGRVIGISCWQLCRIENGQKPIQSADLFRLSRSLGVKDAWLLMESDEGGPPVPTEVLRKQRLMNFQKASHEAKKKRQLQVELERVRGLRPPARPRKPARAAASDPPT